MEVVSVPALSLSGVCRPDALCSPQCIRVSIINNGSLLTWLHGDYPLFLLLLCKKAIKIVPSSFPYRLKFEQIYFLFVRETRAAGGKKTDWQFWNIKSFIHQQRSRGSGCFSCLANFCWCLTYRYHLKLGVHPPCLSNHWALCWGRCQLAQVISVMWTADHYKRKGTMNFILCNHSSSSWLCWTELYCCPGTVWLCLCCITKSFQASQTHQLY